MINRFVQRVKNWIKNNPVVFLCSVLLTLGSSFLLTINIFEEVYDIFSKKQAISQTFDIGVLDVGASIQVFIKEFGDAKFRNKHDGLLEYVFIRANSFIKVFVDKNDVVIGYVVVSLDGSFTPFDVKVAKFSELSQDTVFEYGRSSISARLNFYYFEVYQNGNPYFPKYIFYGIHDLGKSSWRAIGSVSSFEDLEWEDLGDISRDHAVFREKSIPNMYGVFDYDVPYKKIINDESIFGLDSYQLREYIKKAE